MGDGETSNSTKTVLVLLFILVALVLLLLFLYKRLNREAEGEYTIHRIVFKEGGVRDQVRGAVVALETRLGIHLWRGSVGDGDGEEMQEVRDVEDGSRVGNSEEANQDEEEEEEGNHRVVCGYRKPSDSSDSLILEEERGDRTGDEQQGQKANETEEEQVKVEASGGAGLLIDLKQFSGSATWSEEGGHVDVCADVTAL